MEVATTAPDDKRKPWMKFFPADWQADEPLRMCSLSARGLWIEMVATMHKSQRLGYLLIAGKAPTPAQLAASVGSDLKTVNAALKELESWEVFSRDENGVIFSRRMLRDLVKAATDSKNGKGGGNPTLTGKTPQSVNPKSEAKDNPSDAQGLTPPVKAQRLEARGQKESELPAASFPDSRDAGPQRDASARLITPRNPAANDPPDAWLHLADRKPDGTPHREHEPGTANHGRPLVAGGYLDVAAQLTAEAAGWPHDHRADWTMLAQWLRSGADLTDHIVPTVSRLAAGLRAKDGSVAGTLRYFDSAVREAAGRMRA